MYQKFGRPPAESDIRGDTYWQEDVPEVRTIPGRIGHQRRHPPVESSTSWRLPQDWEDEMPLRPDEQQATGDT